MQHQLLEVVELDAGVAPPELFEAILLQGRFELRRDFSLFGWKNPLPRSTITHPEVTGFEKNLRMLQFDSQNHSQIGSSRRVTEFEKNLRMLKFDSQIHSQIGMTIRVTEFEKNLRMLQFDSQTHSQIGITIRVTEFEKNLRMLQFDSQNH